MLAAEEPDEEEPEAEELADDEALAVSFVDDESELVEFEELTVLALDERESVA